MQRAIAVVVCAVALTAARGQETPSLQSGPMMGGAPDASVAMSGEPAGGYRMEPGMTAPKILQAVPAVYPEDASLDGGGRCLLSMVVNRDGMPLFIHVVHSAGEAFDAAAIYAVRQSKFEAGLREQKAVPIRTVVRVTFTADRAAAVPEIVPPVYPEPENAVKADYPPSLLRRAEVEFTDEARRKKINGVVVISFLVTEAGLPADLRLVRGLGYGLDEKAMEAVRQYRFKPAMKDGGPIAQRMSIEVSFRTF